MKISRQHLDALALIILEIREGREHCTGRINAAHFAGYHCSTLGDIDGVIHYYQCFAFGCDVLARYAEQEKFYTEMLVSGEAPDNFLFVSSH